MQHRAQWNTNTTLTQTKNTTASYISQSIRTRTRKLFQRVQRAFALVWHFRRRFLLGTMEQSNSSSHSTINHDGSMSENNRSWWSRWSFDAVVVANHLYLFISSGYLTFNFIRISTQFSDHLHYMLVTDVTLLTLATLFVIDALIYAYLHAASVPPLEEFNVPTPSDASSIEMVESGTHATNEPPTTPAASPSSTRPQLSPIPFSPMNESIPATPKSPSSTVRIAVQPSVEREDSSVMQQRSSAVRRISVRSLAHLHRAFLSSADGVAELLNVVGAFGYLLTALIPFVYFIVSETTERTLDRSANILDNCSMLVFVVDSWLYLYLWRRRPSKAMREQQRQRRERIQRGQGEEEEEERQTLIDASGGSTSSSSTDSKTRSSPPLRSPFDPRERDIYLYGNICNILAGTFYLASTLYGFFVRMQANADLAAIRQLAKSMDAAPSLTGASSSLHSPNEPHRAHRAHAWLTSVANAAGNELLQSASELLHADPTFTSWEAEIEAQFHNQMKVAFIGDCFYFLCAITMEIAYYASIHRQRSKMKSDRTVVDSELDEEESDSGALTVLHALHRPAPQNLPRTRTVEESVIRKTDEEEVLRARPSLSLAPSPAPSSSPTPPPINTTRPLVQMDTSDPTFSMSPNSPPSQQHPL